MGYVLRNKDRLVWHYEQKGCYTVRSGYWLACAIRDREDGEVAPETVLHALWDCPAQLMRYGTFQLFKIHVPQLIMDAFSIYFAIS
ncbi:unnamed protein product [Prunus brigantina]